MGQEITIHVPREMTRAEQIEHILGEVACGRALNSVLTNDPGMPHRATFWRWHMADEALRDNLARARLNGVEALLEDAAEIARTPMEGEEVMMEIGPDGPKRRVTRKDMLGHRRLYIDTIHKRAQMIAPRKYGPKLDVTSDGEKLSSIADAIAAGNKRLAKDGE